MPLYILKPFGYYWRMIREKVAATSNSFWHSQLNRENFPVCVDVCVCAKVGRMMSTNQFSASFDSHTTAIVDDISQLICNNNAADDDKV